jgi:hypothetical protein
MLLQYIATIDINWEDETQHSVELKLGGEDWP